MTLSDYYIIFILFTDAYSSNQLVYEWQSSDSVDFVPGMTLSQFDLKSFNQSNFTFIRREGTLVTFLSLNLNKNVIYGETIHYI